MLNVPTKVRVFLCTRATDMRKSFNGLHGLVLEVLGQDPQSGDLFVFVNRSRDRVKMLIWEGDGMLIVYKRLERGTFAVPPSEHESVTLTSAQLSLLLGGIDLAQTRQRKRYQRPREDAGERVERVRAAGP
jgi:transposase